MVALKVDVGRTATAMAIDNPSSLGNSRHCSETRSVLKITAKIIIHYRCHCQTCDIDMEIEGTFAFQVSFHSTFLYFSNCKHEQM